jgi:pimeloyl-ACP methyl ester carboxylesterase
VSGSSAAGNAVTVHDFTIAVPDDELDDLRRRLETTRWPRPPHGVGWLQGTDIVWLQTLCEYWYQSFDWRAQERLLNSFPNKIISVGGVDIHCVVAPGRGPQPRPLVLTHGWPSSFYEFYKVTGPLSDPASFGGDPMDAFDVIVPSLPGYGFSAAPATGGIGPDQIADLWVDLVAELGYQEFFAHGGDWGAAVTGSLATRHPDRLLGAHFTMFSPPIDPGTLSAEDKEWWDELQAYRDAEWGYVHLQRTKPQTPAFALTDSPVGLAAWILEKWCRWSDCVGENGERDPLLVYSAEELLTNVAIYWFTGSIGSSMRLYYESFGPGSSYGVPSRIEVPTGVSTFKDPNAPPRRLIEPWCDLRHYASFDKGGHFPALENPEAVVSEIRSFARMLR